MLVLDQQGVAVAIIEGTFQALLHMVSQQSLPQLWHAMLVGPYA
jgi:hypothetical protein